MYCTRNCDKVNVKTAQDEPIGARNDASFTALLTKLAGGDQNTR